jgi:ribosome-associated toxin RatA of RatAB toxin-antitoxin module
VAGTSTRYPERVTSRHHDGRRGPAGLLLLALVLASASASAEGAPAAAPAQNAAPAANLGQIPANGEILATNVPHPKSEVQWGRAVGVVDAPFERVMGAVTNYGSYATFLPHFHVSRVLSQRGQSALLYVEASIALDTMKLWAQVKLAPLPAQGTTQIIEAKMMKGNMDVMGARWELTPLDAGHTLVAFQLIMDPSLPLPSGLVSSENLKASKTTIRALRRVLGVTPAHAVVK